MLLYTKSQMEELEKERLKELIEFAGGPSHLAKMLGVSSPSVNFWEKQGRISTRYAEAVEQHPTLGRNFKADYLRPDFNYITKRTK